MVKFTHSLFYGVLIQQGNIHERLSPSTRWASIWNGGKLRHAIYDNINAKGGNEYILCVNDLYLDVSSIESVFFF